MLNKSTQNIVFALFASAALVGLAFYQRYGSPIHISEATFFIFAALICVSPVVYRVLRCRSCGNKTSNVG
ncbi:hypothetical protein [Terracidiphilus gabretensis]|jgi:hypothetical protein|uniref:hypothetical protein n=1 Tax=Terracidiphilus gabretensis TaxID=1577687 RepID=UPI00071B57A1|nr:hypothetical protein [Terracidiphilus gabretensis]